MLNVVVSENNVLCPIKLSSASAGALVFMVICQDQHLASLYNLNWSLFLEKCQKLSIINYHFILLVVQRNSIVYCQRCIYTPYAFGHKCIYMYICVCISVCVCVYVCMCVCFHLCMRVCFCLSGSMCMCAYMSTYLSVSVYICV